MLNIFHTELFSAFNFFSGLHPALDVVLFSLANGTGAALFLLIVVLVFMREGGSKRSLLLLAHIIIPVFIALTYTEVLKTLFQAPRPWESVNDVRLLFEYGGLDSFPSGHATTYGALALSVFFYNKRIGVVFGFIAFFISLSRVIVGIHWPIDIVAGFVIGCAVTYLYYLHIQRKSLF